MLHNVDELFEREEFSAAHDAGWPDCFNSGVFVFRPSDETYQSLLQFATSHGSFDGKNRLSSTADDCGTCNSQIFLFHLRQCLLQVNLSREDNNFVDVIIQNAKVIISFCCYLKEGTKAC